MGSVHGTSKGGARQKGTAGYFADRDVEGTGGWPVLGRWDGMRACQLGGGGGGSFSLP